MPTPPTTDRIRESLPAVAGFGLPFLIVVYLALEAGGYDLVVRGQVGIIAWWIVLLGVIAGLLPLTRVTRGGWAVLAVLGALAAWTAAALTWTESTERGLIELSRVATLLGIFALMLLLQGRDGFRRSVAAVGAAVAVVAVVALASRFQPDWFPASEIPADYPVSRLNHPLEYWNGLAAFMAIGLAPLLWAASSARSIPVRALAAGAVPLVVLACYLTASRGGAIEAGAALLILIVLFPRRLSLLPTLLVTGLGSAVLLLLIQARPELRDLLPGDAAGSQGTEMLWLTLGVFIVVAVLQAVVTTATARNRIVIPRVGRKTARRFGLASGVLALLVVFVALGSGWAGDRWSEFKEPAPGDGTVGRLGNLSSGERYKVWESAVDAGSSEKLTGIGPGTFEFWWAREGTGTQFVRDAHSLYLENLAELGPLGFLLILTLVLGPIVLAGTRALARGSDDRRALLAAAAAGMAAFAVAAGIDWAWELTVLPVMFLILVAATVGPAAESRRGRKRSRFTPVPLSGRRKAGFGLAGVVAILAIAIPLAGTVLVRESERLFREGDLKGSLEKADRATGIQPYSASALDQKSLVLIAAGRPEEALPPALDATNRESTNWRTWFVLESAYRALGDDSGAERAAARARDLNTRSRFLGTGSISGGHP
ncbi:MAG TPA: O-antigen ligase family protein [Solirubrobacterales bacterium]|nr:O-antigen ligase family protein [Solirubrobacterales bacterium]